MRSLLNLWSAVAELATAFSGLAATVREADSGLRQRLQLDVADVIDGEQPAVLPKPKGRLAK